MRDPIKWWKTKSGEWFPIRRMTDSHLQNTISFLEQQSTRELFLAKHTLVGGEWEISYDDEEKRTRFRNVLESLRNERRRRKEIREKTGVGFPDRCSCRFTQSPSSGVIGSFCHSCGGPIVKIEREKRNSS